MVVHKLLRSIMRSTGVKCIVEQAAHGLEALLKLSSSIGVDLDGLTSVQNSEAVDPDEAAAAAAAQAAMGPLQDAKRFDLLVMDVEMPIMDGLLATEAIRAVERGAGARRTPIVALTAHSLDDIREKAMEIGCDEFYAKPLLRTNLMFMIRHYIPEVAGPAFGACACMCCM